MKHKKRIQRLTGLLALALALMLAGCEGSSVQDTEELPQEDTGVEAGTLPSEVGTEEQETSPEETEPEKAQKKQYDTADALFHES